jgi:excisionase family DNA binding protein
MPQRISGDRVLLSTTEAVQLSGLSREHIQRLLRQKLLEGMKLGHDWLLFEDSLEAFLAQPRKTGPKGPHTKPV